MPNLTIFTRTEKRETRLAEHNLIGRHTKNRITIPDPGISSVHCLIEFEKRKRFIIRDLGSLNGTFVNNTRIRGKAVLKDKDEIIIGNTRCVFHTDSSEAVIQFDPAGGQAVPGHIPMAKQPKAINDFLHESKIENEIELRSDYEKLRITYELQRDIGFETDIDKILGIILDRTFEFLACDRGVFLIPDHINGLKPLAYKTTRPDDQFIISSTLIQHIQKNKQGLRTTDALTDRRFDQAKSIILQGLRSTLAVPILDMEELMGILIVESSTKINAFSEKDLHLLMNIANQTAQFIKNSSLAEKIKQDEITRKQFQRLLSPNLAEMVVSGRLKIEKGGESRVATVLFTDIRGFTPMAEKTEPGDLLQMLNDFFEVSVDIVFQYEGTVDKFVGDAMMAIWGAPMDHTDDPARAVNAALDIQNLLKEFNKTRAAEGLQQFDIGIGISTGRLIAGYIGSSRTMSYSVIGDTVNTAHRLCAAAKGGQILVSRNTYGRIKDLFETTGRHSIPAKGKYEPIEAYSVLSQKP